MLERAQQFFATLSPRQWLGYALLLLSTLVWLGLLAVPFLDMDMAAKLSLSAAIFVFYQITWWSGVALLGPEFVKWSRQAWEKYRHYLGLSPRVNKSDPSSTENPAEAAPGQ